MTFCTDMAGVSCENAEKSIHRSPVFDKDTMSCGLGVLLEDNGYSILIVLPETASSGIHCENKEIRIASLRRMPDAMEAV